MTHYENPTHSLLRERWDLFMHWLDIHSQPITEWRRYSIYSELLGHESTKTRNTHVSNKEIRKKNP